MAHPDSQAMVQFGLGILANLKAEGVILGAFAGHQPDVRQAG